MDNGKVENKWATFQDGTGEAFPDFAEAATRLRAEALQRASAQAARHFAVLTYSMYAPRVNTKVFPFGIS